MCATAAVVAEPRNGSSTRSPGSVAIPKMRAISRSGFVVAAPGKHKEAKEGSKRDIAEEATGLELTEGGGGAFELIWRASEAAAACPAA